MATVQAVPTVATVDQWYKEKILPTRTAWAGFSPNRVWRGPRSFFTDNAPDPNGLCGDVAAYVDERFFEDLGYYHTQEGYQLGAVLWTGSVLNHIANVMMEKGKTAPQTYRWDRKTASAVPVGKSGKYGSTTLLALPVYDLYYKKARMPLKNWWSFLDAEMDGTIKIAPLSAIGD